MFLFLPQSYDAANGACTAFDRLRDPFPSAKINPVKSVRNRIISMGKCLLFA